MRAINLIPVADRQQGMRLTNLSPMTLTLIGVLLAALVAVTALVMANNRISDRREELAGVQSQTARTQAQLDALTGNAATLETLERSEAAVRNLAAARYDWPALFSRLASSLPTDVKLTTMNGTGGGGPSATSAGSTLELTGCAGSLRTLASALQRMRAVRGVSAVTLSQSSHVVGDGAACPHPRSFNLSVTLDGSTSASTGGAP